MSHPILNKVYFDCNATTSVLPEAVQASLQVMQHSYGNPSSVHSEGVQAKAVLESARRMACDLISADDPTQIIFTSGATEAIQLAVFSALHELFDKPSAIILYGATEHKAVPEALQYWVNELKLPNKILQLPVDANGQYDLEFLKKESHRLGFLCTMAVNNETGVIHNLKEIEKLIGPDTLWLVDGVQGLGKMDFFLNRSRINYFSASGHKLYAQKGTGFLYVKKNSPLKPMMVGGGQERGLRSGTENLPGVASFGVVLNEFKKLQENKPSLFYSHATLLRYRDRIVTTLKKAFPKIVFNTPFEFAAPTTINFSIPGFTSAELMDLFDSAGIRLSAGSACSSASVKPSHVLEAMGLEPWRCESALRLSFGAATPELEIENGCKLILECAAALQESCMLETVVSTATPDDIKDGLIQFRAGANNTWMYTHQASKNCIIIDPCDTSADRVENYIQCQDLNVLAVLDTHSHADHESIRPSLQKAIRGKTWGDALGWPDSKESFEITLDDGSLAQAIAFDSHTVLARIATPGHTQDSMLYLLGEIKNKKMAKNNVKFAFCGDTILTGGLGRTNFKVSKPEALFSSLHQIQKYINPNTTLLCPSHDYQNSFSTTLSVETEENPLLKKLYDTLIPISCGEFVAEKRGLDAKLEDLEKDFKGIVCGVTPQGAKICESFTLNAEQLKQKKNKVVIDVREPHEFAFDVNWSDLGLKQTPRNVPLSRFVSFMNELLIEKNFDRELIFLCRSGTRSLHVTKTLRRLGFNRVWNLDGGLALGLK